MLREFIRDHETAVLLPTALIVFALLAGVQ